MKIKIQKGVSPPGRGADEKEKMAASISKMKIGESTLIDYMLWDRIGSAVRIILKYKYGQKVTSLREKGRNIKKTRVWRIE